MTATNRAVLAASLLAFACTIGPDFEPPTPPLPDSGRFEGAPTASVETAKALEELAWWRDLGDPVLADLVERATRSNPSLEIAAARIREARAARRARGGRLLPTLDGGASAGRSRSSATGPGPLAELAEAGLAELENELFTVGFDAAWEIDLFGRLRRAREAAQARLEGAEEARRATLLTVAAETARAYVELRGAEHRLDLAERNLGLQEESTEVIRGKVETGILPEIDLQRSAAQLASVRATLAPLRAARQASRFRLAVLLGLPPGGLAGELGSSSIPEPPEAVASGLPADLIARRPDLRLAEHELRAASAEIGVALGDRLPRLLLGGSRGFESATLSDLLQSASRAWSLGPRIDLPLFRGGQLAAGVEAARARYEAAEASWRRQVLGALEEVESALVAYQQAHQARTARREAATASRRASDLASVLYEEGLRDHLVLLDAQRTVTAADDALAVAETEVALRAIALYKSLGGGWRALETEATASPGPEDAGSTD